MKNLKRNKMEKLITLIILVSLVSCNEPKEKSLVYKYKTGDIVYLKLDGTKVMIAKIAYDFDIEPHYKIYYKNSDGDYTSNYVEEFCLTEKIK